MPLIDTAKAGVLLQINHQFVTVGKYATLALAMLHCKTMFLEIIRNQIAYDPFKGERTIVAHSKNSYEKSKNKFAVGFNNRSFVANLF